MSIVHDHSMERSHKALTSYYQRALADDREADAIAAEVAAAETAAGHPVTRDGVWLRWRQQAIRETAAANGHPHSVGLSFSEQQIANGWLVHIARQAAEALRQQQQAG